MPSIGSAPGTRSRTASSRPETVLRQPLKPDLEQSSLAETTLALNKLQANYMARGVDCAEAIKVIQPQELDIIMRAYCEPKSFAEHLLWRSLESSATPLRFKVLPWERTTNNCLPKSALR
jgi:hypothetical protein